ncbi:MAG: N-acetyl-gamma-glutamyl-phosphate reductase [Oleiphilaceae bacterium]|nr:N-acetyl-gamma-glutamyl-phosphate reductase [Oleiphilaceae bacterium]
MIKAGIVGATGYTGSELLRLLVNHPDVEVTAVTSRAEQGSAVADMFPQLRGYLDLEFTAPDPALLKECDVLFFATPHGVAQAMMKDFAGGKTRIIDLSADFRIKDQATWEAWYKQAHACPEWIDQAVYGLPEMNRDDIAGASLIACPGCYPTAIQLGFIPALEQDLIDTQHLIADAKSGVSGAGRGANVATLMAECSDSFKAYGVSGHRHLPEIKQGLQAAAKSPVALTFVPHLVPMIRGIEATLYAPLKGAAKDISLEEIQAVYEARYANEPFVDVLPLGSLPETRFVKGSNFCRIALHRQPESDTLIVVSVIDNLVKGASGQAVQNMNIAFGLPENSGLRLVPLMP